MSAVERRALRGVDVPGLSLGAEVWRMSAARAIAQFRPELIIAAWLPPTGPLLGSLIRSPVRFVMDVGAAGGVTPGAWNWRYAHELCDGPLESLARCRLDARPEKALASRVTLYFGKAHSEYHCERVRPGDWLWQFRPE